MAAQTELVLQTSVKGSEKATKAINDIKGSLKGVSTESKSLGDRLSSLGKSFIKLGTLGITALGGLGAYGLKTAGDFEQTSTAFRTMLGDGEKAGKLLQELSDFAKETPFEFPEIANAGKSLLAFGIEAGKVKGTLRTLGDIASSLNIPIGELSEIYGKIKTQGRVFAEDINQLTGRGIPIIAELAKQFGVAEGEVKKLVENGKIGFPEIQKAMESMAGEGGKFAGGMINQSKTLQGLLSTAKDGLGNILNEIIGINQKGEITAGSILDKAKGVTAGFVEFLDKNKETIKTFFTAVFEGFSEFFSILSTIVEKGLGIVRDFWTENGAQIKFAVQEVTASLLTFWSEYGNEIKLVLDVIINIFKIAFDAIKNIVQVIMLIIGPLIEGTMSIIGGAIRAVAGLLTGDFSLAWEGIKAVISGVIEVLSNIVIGFFDLVARVFGTDIVKVIDTTINYLIEKAAQAKRLASQILDSYTSSGVGKVLAMPGQALGNLVYGARASGGPVSGGKPYLVGEKGPEIFTPGSSGNIIPNNRIGGSSGGSIVINISGIFGSDAVGEISDQIVQNLKRASYV